MDIATGNWFNYLNENMLTEGLRDIGIPEFVIDYIEVAMPNASEKAKVYIGKHWKEGIGQMRGAYTIQTLQYEMVDKLIRDYGDYVYPEPGHDSDRSRPSDVAARTVEPYDTSAIRTTPRAEYSEERIKQGEQVKFVIQNLKNVVGRPMGIWRKAFLKAVKALSKAGIPSEKVENTQEYLAGFYQRNFDFWVNKYTELIAFLNDDPTNYELIKGEEDIREAQKTAEKYLEELEDPENILHTFEDGSYWYNLDVSNCDVEGSRMGHCGSDGRGVLVSLRKKQGKRKESSSYITMTWSSYENTLYQIKGRNNDAPPEEIWGHIEWFIDNMGIEKVEETGEHSNDEEGIQAMIEYLSENTSAEFHGTIEERMENATIYCDAIDQRFYDSRDEIENASISYSLEEMENDVYAYISADYTFDINLGWTGMRDTGEDYRAREPQDFTPIPSLSDHRAMSDFVNGIGLDDMIDGMPGDDGDYQYEIKMLEGVTPGWELGDPPPEPAAHLSITLRTSETAAVDEDGEVREYDDFADNMLAFEEDGAAAAIEEIRQALSAGGYMARTAYDRNKEGLESLTDLDKWHVKKEKGGLEFDWTAEDGQPIHYYTGPFDSARAQMYGTGTGNVMGVNPDAVFKEIFGYGKQYRFANMLGLMDAGVAAQFSQRLGRTITAQLMSSRSEDQEEFDFGDKYKSVEPAKVLADDTDFVIFPKINYGEGQAERARYPKIGIAWLYRIRVGPNSPMEEFDVIKDIAEYLNAHPELVEKAANETIALYLDGFMENIERRKNKITSSQEIQTAINTIKETYGRIEAGGAIGDISQKMYTMALWFEENYADMDELMRYVMSTKFLIPMAQNRFRAHSEMGQISDTGAPVMFPELVARQIEMMGGQPVSMVNRRDKTHVSGAPLAGQVGEPRDAGGPVVRNARGERMTESVEQQIARIERLLSIQAPMVEEVDIRLYKMHVDAKISDDRTKRTKQLQDELRGITNVTTVTSEASREIIGGQWVRFGVKFTLQGQKSRKEFVETFLIPSMNRIVGVDVINKLGVGWSMPEEVKPGKNIRESEIIQEYGASGGVASNLGAQRHTYGKEMETPRPQLQSVLDDWVDGGVMAYDAPTDTTDMRYHVMMPVEELIPFMSSEYRGDANDFVGRYQNFIKNGATAPVYVAVGMNNRIKITGNEDIVWFAKKSGLEEVPIFLSFQKQA